MGHDVVNHGRRALVALAIVAGTGGAAVGAISSATATADSTPIYENQGYTFAERAADLVSRMTLAEKASEMNSSMAAAITRLNIPAYSWWNEAAHGVSCEGMTNNSNCSAIENTTSYPTGMAMASTWNPSIEYHVGSAVGDEAREVENNNTLNMDFYAPVVNLLRDPRWGRSDEAFSEDPYLTAKIAGQFVNGMQGQSMHGELLKAGNGYYKTIATLKHYAANNSEVNRLNGNAVMDERTLREYYTEQFRDIVKAAHPGSMMSSYNEVNGVPSPASIHLTDTLARETFGFGGYFTSDCDAIYEEQSGHNWIPANSKAPVNVTTRHAYALSAGEDLDCNTGYNDGKSYATQLPAAIGTHTLADTLSQNDLDVSLERLFTARMSLGEFDAADGSVPWVNDARQRVPQGSWQNNDANAAVTETPARLQLARKAADQSIVLLKNDPPSAGAKPLLPLQVPSSGAYRVAVVGYFASPVPDPLNNFANPNPLYLGDYSSVQSAAGIRNEVSGLQGITAALHAINPAAVVNYFPGVVGGNSASTLNTVDPASVAAVQNGNYDAVIAYVGSDASIATESHDRSSTALPGAQASMVQQLAAASPNTIVYMETGGMEDVSSFVGSVHAMLWSSYNGMRKGEALADVLLGTYNPSGHLPFTWYKGDSSLPSVTDYSIRPDGKANPGRTYMYYTGKPQFPFGYGLSYTTFKYSNMKVVDPSADAGDTDADANDTLHISVDVTNTGSVAGATVAQLYANTPDAPAALQRPIKRLEGSRWVFLGPRQTKTVNFTLPIPNLAFFSNDDNRWEVDPGSYGLQISGSAADSAVQQQQLLQVHGVLHPTVSVITAKPTTGADQLTDVHDRVMFPANSQVIPNLTIDMSDDTLYGYVTKGQSTPIPDDMHIKYRSDRPDVVTVSPDGTINTTGTAGVATVTATVEYHGRNTTGQFVIDNVPTTSY